MPYSFNRAEAQFLLCSQYQCYPWHSCSLLILRHEKSKVPWNNLNFISKELQLRLLVKMFFLSVKELSFNIAWNHKQCQWEVWYCVGALFPFLYPRFVGSGYGRNSVMPWMLSMFTDTSESYYLALEEMSNYNWYSNWFTKKIRPLFHQARCFRMVENTVIKWLL